MNTFVKLLVIIFVVTIFAVILVTTLDVINRKYFFDSGSAVTVCFNNCTQYICDDKVRDMSVFSCMDTSKFTDVESAELYFERRKEELENSQLKNEDCFTNEPVLYKECSTLDRVTELNKNVRSYFD